MPALTRSSTAKLRYEADQKVHYDHMRSLYAKIATFTEPTDRVKVLQEILDFVKESKHMLKLIQTDVLFRRVLYVKCAEFSSSPQCTKRLAFSCKAMRRRIDIMGGV
jgi:hypothetical protein